MRKPLEGVNRTLTGLYNANPTWLRNAHRKLDEAVLAAYGGPPDLPDDALLRCLLELYRARSTAKPLETA